MNKKKSGMKMAYLKKNACYRNKSNKNKSPSAPPPQKKKLLISIIRVLIPIHMNSMSEKISSDLLIKKIWSKKDSILSPIKATEIQLICINFNHNPFLKTFLLINFFGKSKELSESEVMAVYTHAWFSGTSHEKFRVNSVSRPNSKFGNYILPP